MTQNQNKSLNNTVWARCPERVFCRIHRLKVLLYDAICTFNSGTESRRHLLDSMGLLNSINIFYGLEKENRKTILDAGRNILEKYKHRQRFLRSQKKKKKLISECYIPGAIGLNKASDFVVSTEEEDKTTLELKFISVANVANMIYDRF